MFGLVFVSLSMFWVVVKHAYHNIEWYLNVHLLTRDDQHTVFFRILEGDDAFVVRQMN
jgi:hypothetical protein